MLCRSNVEQADSSDVESRTVQSDYIKNMYSLLNDSKHFDVQFLVGPDKHPVPAHKGLLAARSEYFRAMFQPEGMLESARNAIEIPDHHPAAFKRMLEFLYTNDLRDITTCDADDLINLLCIGNEYIIPGLKLVCQKAAESVFSPINIGRFAMYCDMVNNIEFKETCLSYMKKNFRDLHCNSKFRQEVSDSPSLALMVVDAIDIDSNERPYETSISCRSNSRSVKRMRV